MGLTEWLPIPLSQLELGLPLRYDIYTESGDHLADAGEEFTQSVKASWIQLGISTVCAKVEKDLDESALFRPYDAGVIQRIEENLDMAAEILVEMSASLNGKQAFTSMEFNELTTRMVSDIQTDNAAALVTLADAIGKPQSTSNRILADRSSQLALLCMIVAQEMGLVPAECHIVGTAAMLHDISLMGFEVSEDPDEVQEQYQQHPLMSANIVDTIVGLNPKVGMVVSQVHESPRGDGFPRGLHANRIMPLARIINLTDTFLTLTTKQQPFPMPEARNYHPADALGYIMYHTAHGQFEMDAVRSLIRAGSLYPIGSSVKLSDDSTAVVFRSTRVAPSKPIVRLESQELLDLRNSHLSILGPARDSRNFSLLRKSQLGEIMWG